MTELVIEVSNSMEDIDNLIDLLSNSNTDQIAYIAVAGESTRRAVRVESIRYADEDT